MSETEKNQQFSETDQLINDILNEDNAPNPVTEKLNQEDINVINEKKVINSLIAKAESDINQEEKKEEVEAQLIEEGEVEIASVNKEDENNEGEKKEEEPELIEEGGVQVEEVNKEDENNEEEKKRRR